MRVDHLIKIRDPSFFPFFPDSDQVDFSSMENRKKINESRSTFNESGQKVKSRVRRL
jgi:hypothetical protein